MMVKDGCDMLWYVVIIDIDRDFKVIIALILLVSDGWVVVDDG